jgi:hypothetical protein
MSCPQLFVEKTLGVVIIGGVKMPENVNSGEKMLLPDMEASNNRGDPAASSFLVKKCQEYCVRLLAISRAVASEFKFPRSVFDTMLSDGGENSFGRRVADMQKKSLEELWGRVNATGPARQGLPERCNVQWFQETFCQGEEVTTSCWEAVKQFNTYTPLALLAAVPRICDQSFESTSHTVRGIEHRIFVGSSHAGNCAKIASIVQHCVKLILKGILMNVSDFTTKREIMVEGMFTFNVNDAMPNWLDQWQDKQRRDSGLFFDGSVADEFFRRSPKRGEACTERGANSNSSDEESDDDEESELQHHRRAGSRATLVVRGQSAICADGTMSAPNLVQKRPSLPY